MGPSSAFQRFRLQIWRRITGPQLFVGSFLLLVIAGALGLMFLPGLYTGESLGWLDAFFTSTSAVCVTGLIVVDTATYFTAAGQLYLLILIQLGGLGMITFATTIISALGGRLSLRHEAISRSTTEVTPHIDYLRLARDVIIFTLSLEVVGAVLLYAFWVPDFGWTGAIWPAVFHSVSAFCNAGFSIFSNSLMDFQSSPHVLLVVMTLIVLGGIGFLSIEEIVLYLRTRHSRRRLRLSLHSRLVLGTTMLLILGGWMALTTFEWNVSLGEMSLSNRLINGLFMSITARTAGFNTIDYAEATDGGNFLTIILMSIGGSPGSTAGGLKTTTIAIIGLVAYSRIRGHIVTSIGGRSVPEETVQRAVGLFVVAFGAVTVGIFAYMLTETDWAPHFESAGIFLTLMFEAVSAFNTVGLSMGITGDLSGTGRFMTILLMFIGRVGPLTFAAALARRRRTHAKMFRYAYEDVAIG